MSNNNDMLVIRAGSQYLKMPASDWPQLKERVEEALKEGWNQIGDRNLAAELQPSGESRL